MEFNSPDNSFIDPNRLKSYPTSKLSDFALVDSYDKFDKLTFWNKIEFLQQTVDKKLLQEIREKISSKQMQALTIFRLHTLDKV
jgi:hypothetical protein